MEEKAAKKIIPTSTPQRLQLSTKPPVKPFSIQSAFLLLLLLEDVHYVCDMNSDQAQSPNHGGALPLLRAHFKEEYRRLHQQGTRDAHSGSDPQ